MKRHDRSAHAASLLAWICMLCLAGCATSQQRPLPSAVPKIVLPAAHPGPIVATHAVAARHEERSTANAPPPRLAPTVVAQRTVAASPQHTPLPVISPQRKAVSVVAIDDRTKPLAPHALALQTIALKKDRLAPEFGHVRVPYTFGEIEAAAVRYAGGPCTATIYRMAWFTAERFDIEPVVVAALIEIESGCRIDAVSTAGARGLMQLMPAFGARDGYRYVYGMDHEPSANELGDPAVNIRLGVAYLGILRDHYAYVDSPRSRLMLAVASYNCGPGFLDRRLPAESGHWKAEEAALWLAGHVPDETRAFVVAVLERAGHYQSAIVTARKPAPAAAKMPIGSH